MHVLLVAVARHPRDRRIGRQARAMHDAGHAVTLAAPFSASRTTAPPWVNAVDLPGARGWHRRQPVLAARALIWGLRDRVDIVVLHDPELVLAVAGREDRLPPVVWDVHEDTASPDRRAGVPAPARPLVRAAETLLERSAEDRMHLLLAEQSYARRFSRPHPVVPDSSTVPETVSAPGPDRVVYTGDVTGPRGAVELLETARRLRRHGIRTELLGTPDRPTRRMLQDAADAGTVEWTELADDEAFSRLDGALAGLSLRRDAWAYRMSTPIEIVQYMARGIPTVCTPLPLAARLVREQRCGVVVPFGGADSAVRIVIALRDDPGWRAELGRRAHRAARRDHRWPDHAATFVAQLERWAPGRDRTRPP